MSARDAYAAIAEPTRRQILTLLRDDGMLPAGEIASRFPATSRPGISRHLRVLRECGVVHVTREGKHRCYSINAKPLREIAEGWLSGFAGRQSTSLAALRVRAESAHAEDC